MLVALWVLNGKRGERNREKVKQENGNQDNSDTRVGERKVGDAIVQCTPEFKHAYFWRVTSGGKVRKFRRNLLLSSS